VLGEKIQRLRMERGLTLSQLADQAHVAKSYLSYIERGIRKNPSISLLHKIASVLDTDVQLLLKTREMPPAHPLLNELDEEWLDLIVTAIHHGMTKEQFRAFQWFLRNPPDRLDEK
jgi:XRE family transcriptional regulator of biofilm formation